MTKNKILHLFFILSLLASPTLYGQQKNAFTPTPEEQQTVDSLTSIYQQQGVETRYGGLFGPTQKRPDTPADSSIRVDRDSLIHTYTPSELIKKVLLKSTKPAYADRIKNVQHVGYGGTGEIDQTEWVKNKSLRDEIWDAEDRSIAYFEGDKVGRFPLEKGLILSTAGTHNVEGPNESLNNLYADLRYSPLNVNDRVRSFDADVTYTSLLAESKYAPTTGTIRGALIEFDFSPASTEIFFDYIFGSEMYSTWVGRVGNDAFGFYVSGPFDEPPAGSPEVTYDLGLDREKHEKRPLTKKPFTVMEGVSSTPKINTIERGIIDGRTVKKYNRYNMAVLPNGDPVGVSSVNWGYRSGEYIVENERKKWGLKEGDYFYPDKLPFDEEPDEQGLATNLLPGFKDAYRSNFNASKKIDPAQGHLKDQMAAKEVYDYKDRYPSPKPNDPPPPPPAPFKYEPERAVNMVYFRPIPIYDPLTEMNGLTTKLTARADSLIPNKWYHLKIVLGKNGYQNGSVVFLSNLDLGDITTVIDPIPEKEGAGWNSAWDTIYAAAGNPLDEQARFPLYSGSDRTFTTVVTTPRPGSSYLVFEREGVAKKEHLTLFLNGEPMTSDSVLLKNKTESFNFTMRSHSLPTDLEGEKGRLLTYNSATSVIKDTVIHYTAYNPPSVNIRYHTPTVNYQGLLDLGIQGGTPHLFRSLDQGKNWTLASEPFSARELMRMHDADTIKILLRAPNCACDDIVVELIPGSGTSEIIRSIQLLPFPHATIDKAIGFHRINSGDDFEFIITPHADQADKTPMIRTNRKIGSDDQKNPQLTKRDDGSYHVVIKKVTEDLQISLEMVVVSNEASIENGHVWSRGKQLFVHATNQQSVAVYTLTGAIKKRFTLVAGETRSLILPAGVYLVRLKESGDVYKTIVTD